MDPELQERIVKALREAARTARDSDTQADAQALVALLTQPVPEHTPLAPTPPPPAPEVDQEPTP